MIFVAFCERSVTFLDRQREVVYAEDKRCEGLAMPLYELKLYKPEPGGSAHKLLDHILFEANNDEQAIATAPFLDALLYDESELRLLFSEGQKRVWMLDP